MSSDSEEEDELGQRIASPASDDDLQGTGRHRASNQPNSVLRPPVGHWSGDNPSQRTHNAAPRSAPQSQYLPGQAPPPKQTHKSKGKSREHPSDNNPSKAKRKARSPVVYIPWMPGDNPPSSATLSATGTPQATTFVGDAARYLTSDRNKLPPGVAEEREYAMKHGDNFNYYQPVGKVYAPDGSRIMPYPKINGQSPPPSYPPGPSNIQRPHYDTSEQNQEAQLSPSSSGSQTKKYRSSHRHREHFDSHSNNHSIDHQDQQLHYQQGHPPPSTEAPVPQQPMYVQPGAPGTSPGRIQLRILTLLIEDLRRDDSEKDQLAEIKVPLKRADNPEDGFWADAKEVCRELQAGPARIDGPAKAFTKRGKYRQYFLRVTAEGTDEYSSANLRVEKDRTLQVLVEGAPNTVETLPPPFAQTPRLMTPTSINGAIGSPRSFGSVKRKHDDISRSIERQDTVPFPYASPQSQYTQISPAQISPAYSQRSFQSHSLTDDIPPPGKKPKLSPTASSTEEQPSPGGNWEESPNAKPGKKSKLSPMASSTEEQPSPGGNWEESPNAKTPGTVERATSSPQRDPSAADVKSESSSPPATPHLVVTSSPDNVPSPKLDPLLDRSRNTPAYLGLVTGSESHKHTKTDTAVINWLKTTITQETGWNEFVESRRVQITVGEQLKHYRFVQNKCDQFVGGMTPPDWEDAPSVSITKTHVVAVFGQAPSWGETCTEALLLTELYGPGGSRLEDERVVAMLDKNPAVSTGMEVREYLKLLRQIDQDWDNKHDDS